jgi:hypothetical protein
LTTDFTPTLFFAPPLKSDRLMIEEVIGFYMGGDFKALAAIVAARE